MFIKGSLTILTLCGLCCIANATGLLNIFRKNSDKTTINDYSGIDGVEHFYRYETISLYLEEHLQRFEVFYQDVSANIKVARKMYDEYQKTNQPDKEGMLDAIRLFVSLDSIKYDNSCNQHSADILWNNYKAANNYPHRGYAKELSQRRINQMVEKVILAHHITCNGKYFAKFDQSRAKVDSKSFSDIESMVKGLINYENKGQVEKIYGSAQDLISLARDDSLMFKIINDMPYILETLTSLAKGDPSLKDLEAVKHEHYTDVDYNKVEALVNKYMAKPCQVYTAATKDVFIPADFDAKPLSSSSGHEVHQEKLNFYQGWAAYSVCDAILANEHQIVYNIKEYKERKAGN